MAAGDVTPKRLAGPSVVAITNTVVLTVAALRRQVTKQIIICNTTAVDSWISLAIGTTATAGNCFLNKLPIVAQDTVVLDTALVLVAAETIQGISQAGAVNVTITGWEEEL